MTHLDLLGRRRFPVRPMMMLMLMVLSARWAWAAPEAELSSALTSHPTPTAAPELDAKALHQRLEQDLAGARDELSRLSRADENSQSVLSAGMDIELSSKRALLQLLVSITELQIHRLNDLALVKNQSRQLERDLANWVGYVEAPPSPFLKREELRELIGTLDLNSASQKNWLELLRTITTRREAAVADLAVKLRQLDESLESASEPALQTTLTAQHDLLNLQNRVALARVMTANLESQRISEEILQNSLRQTLAQRQLNALPQPIVFTSSDLKTIHARLDDERSRLQTETDEVVKVMQDAAVRHPPFPSDSDGGASPEQAGGSAPTTQNDKLQSFDVKLQALNTIADFLRLQKDLWEVRWRSEQIRDRSEATDAYARIGKERVELKSMSQYFGQERIALLNRMTAAVDDVESDSQDADWIDRNRGLYLDRVSALSRVLGTLESTASLLDRWEADLDERFAAKSFSDQATEALSAASDLATDFWDFELFAAEDTIEVDGQKVSGKRSVTVGKVLTALGILIIGCWAAARLAALVERISVSHAGMDPSHARIARRWILFVEVMIIAAVSLAVVHIPLTIFAFMGGAVAIGAGFGMQNLLKNLISGLMLLLERPFRPGDLVDVGGIRGWVMDIGMRSSHIRDDNGIETLIPNSTFVEENVTNWTLSSQSVRITVKVGVAYGSPAHEVTELLLDVAERHGLVQDNPPPQVLLEDFGSDALLFGLDVWVGLHRDLEWRVVASDLRFMINKSFASRGIVISFPQRDVHLNADKPLAVRVLSDTENGHLAVKR